MTFSYDGANAVTVRPPQKPPANTGNWAKDVTAPGSGDGTIITASLLNQIVANLRRAVTGMGIPLTEGNDDMLMLAIKNVLKDPSFSGIPTAPTASPGTDTDQIATTAFVQAANDLQDAQVDADIEALNEVINLKANIESPTFTGLVTLPGDPFIPLAAATKQYVDMVAAGFKMKLGCKAASTANLTLSAPQTVDTIALIAGDRVLAKNQTDPTQNGIYVVAAAAWTRATDFDLWAEIPGALCPVDSGATMGKTVYVCTAPSTGTIGTNAVTFSVFSVLGATLTALGQLSPVANTVPYFNTANTAALAAFDVFARTLLASTDANAARALLQAEALGQIAVINTQPASYTLQLTDKGGTVEMNNAGANTLTIPPNSAVPFPVTTYINVSQIGAGPTTIAAGAGVTIHSAHGFKMGGQWALASIYKRGADEWVVGGDVQL